MTEKPDPGEIDLLIGTKGYPNGRCTAQSKTKLRAGLTWPESRCEKPCRAGFRVCRYHGAGKIGGPAGGGQITTGRYASVLPRELGRRYVRGLQDPELLALRDEIALLDGRATELLEQLPGDVEAGSWRLVAQGMNQVRLGMETGTPRMLTDGFALIERAVEEGIKRSRLWGDLLTIWDARRKLVEAERRRIVEAEQVLTAQEAMVLLAQIQQVIVEVVSDRKTRSAIAAGLKGIAAQGAIDTTRS